MFIAERIISLVAPHKCLSCGNEGKLICQWCLPELLIPLPSRCFKCFKATKNFEVCQTHKRLSPLRHVWVVSEYEGIAKDLIAKLKFQRANAAADVIGQLLDEAMPVLDSNTVITYLPTATSRRRLRGYDQAQLLAKVFSQLRELPFHRFLERHGQSRQVGAKRDVRIKQAVGSYYPINISQLKGANILLVDDIVTTGASLESAAKVLKKAGAKKVDALVFATAK